jgi:hypothetical protein
MGSNQGYFCDGKCPDSIAEALFQKVASRNGVPEPLSHIIKFTSLGVSWYSTALVLNKLAYFVQFLKEKRTSPL